MIPGGTPRELLPITEQVLCFVAAERLLRRLHPDDIRRIELVALATREACMFFDLYGAEPTGRIVPRDPEDDSGYYLPKES